MSIALRAAALEDAPQAVELLLSSRRAFLPYAPSAHTDAEVHRWVREALIPSGGVTVACAGTLVVGVLATTRTSGVSWVNCTLRQATSGKASVRVCLVTHSSRCPCRYGSTLFKPTHAQAHSTSATASRQSRSATALRMRSTVPMFCTNLPFRHSLGHNPAAQRTRGKRRVMQRSVAARRWLLRYAARNAIA